jgi:DNA-binding LacI/PurR family transcriptional regulator
VALGRLQIPLVKQVNRMGLVAQTVTFLRAQLRDGKWAGKLPGIQVMAVECGVSHDTMRAAVRQLEADGWIVPGGSGRCREVATAVVQADPQKLRVMVFLSLPIEDDDSEAREVLWEMRALIEGNGHTCQFAPKTLRDLKHDLRRVKQYVGKYKVDAWVVAAATKEVLEWFASQSTPAMALGGSSLSISIAGTGWVMAGVMKQICQRLIELGHRRIVFVATEVIRRSPLADVMRNELEARGVVTGSYHLPVWDQTPDGLQELLSNTFRISPPTALIIELTNWLPGILAFLAKAELRVPQDVSLVYLENDPSFVWHRPPISHVWNGKEQLAANVARWVNGLMWGNEADRRFRPVPAKFIETESVRRLEE